MGIYLGNVMGNKAHIALGILYQRSRVRGRQRRRCEVYIWKGARYMKTAGSMGRREKLCRGSPFARTTSDRSERGMCSTWMV